MPPQAIALNGGTLNDNYKPEAISDKAFDSFVTGVKEYLLAHGKVLEASRF